MSKHTPGPWELVNGFDVFSQLGADSGDGCKASDSDGWLIAEIPEAMALTDAGPETELSRTVREANARLIAAAPELLEALEQCSEYVAQIWSEAPEDAPWFLETSLAAIAKARGEAA